MPKEQVEKPSVVPAHAAIIMDGNGRWAQRRLMPRPVGHRAGMESMRQVIQACDDWGIKALTVYAFSSENWQRPTTEVSALMNLLVEYLTKELKEMHEKGMKIRMMGTFDAAPQAVKDIIAKAVQTTKDNQGLQFNIAFGYGSRLEILRAVQSIALLVKQGLIDPENIDESLIEQHLYTDGLPPVDCIIRTGGDKRLSNFLLYQAAYAELIFTDTLWPDFDRRAFAITLHEFAKRQRRFGKV